jgi:hypothetical protein
MPALPRYTEDPARISIHLPSLLSGNAQVSFSHLKFDASGTYFQGMQSHYVLANLYVSNESSDIFSINRVFGILWPEHSVCDCLHANVINNVCC